MMTKHAGAGHALLEVLLVASLAALLLCVSVPVLLTLLGASRLESGIQNLVSALLYARSEALCSARPVTLAGLHMRRNQTKNGRRKARLDAAQSWRQGILLYADQPGGRGHDYDRQEDLRDYGFAHTLQVSAAHEQYTLLPSGRYAAPAPPLFVLRESWSRRCAVVRITTAAPWPVVCRGRACPECA